MQKTTAMQQLKDKLQFAIEELGEARPGTEISGYRFAMISVVNDIDAQMMELEKQQLEAKQSNLLDECPYCEISPVRCKCCGEIINQ